ncbi:MAG: SH3 domain-containing protein [Clostridia bacterium]|nr:SH3 domain-containing protein [Clostridia bacterium]
MQRKEVENKEENEPEKNSNSSQKIGYISGTEVNFRKTPNTSGEIIKTLTRNNKLVVLELGDEWSEVEYEGTRGYVATDFITFKQIETTSRGGSIVRTGKKTEEINSTRCKS